MKNIILCLVLVMSARLLKSQTNFGRTMIIGSWGYKIKYVAPNIYLHDTLIPIPTIGFMRGSSSISDSNGNLLLMSDGYSLYNSTGQFIDNGDTLSPKGWYNFNQGEGRYTQTSLILPMTNKKYYFINTSMTDTQFTKAINAPDWTYPTNILLYHVVDMNANGGAGKVTERMKPLIENVDLYPSAMMACRHANGKDWWLLKQAGDSTNGNRIFTFLFTQDSVYSIDTLLMPYPFADKGWNLSQYAFSMDGSKWAATLSWNTERSVYTGDFDRCTGQLTNFNKLTVMPYMSYPPTQLMQDSMNAGVCFSPNGQFLYITRYGHVVQYNLQSNSQYKVCGLDTTEQAFAGYTKINLCVDGRIYISHFHGISSQMSYIENPDIEGIGCNFCRKCIRSEKIVNGYLMNVGEMPNYELGADLPCWPLGNGAVVQSEKKIKLYPNPFSEQLTLEYVQQNNEMGSLDIFDITGKVLFHTELSGVSSKVSVSLPSFSKGVYLYKYRIDGKMVETGKLLKD